MSNKDNDINKFDTFEGIIVDTREPMEQFESNWLFFLDHAMDSKKLPKFRYKALPYGDYLICTKNHRLLIERKEVHDYCRSLGESLEERFNHMRIENELTMLLVEGSPVMMDQNIVYRWDNHGQFLQKAADLKTFKNFQLAQQLNGSMFTRTDDYKDTVLTLITYYNYLINLPANEENCICKPWERWFALAPFVGKRSTKKLTQKYGSCYDALVHIEDWATEKIIKGIKENWNMSRN